MHAVFLFVRLGQLLLWLSANLVFRVVQFLIWELNGTASARRQSVADPDSKSSAQVLSVRARFKFCDFVAKASKWDFLLTHERFESAQYVLQDHITLYAVTDTEAIFVETTPGRKVWDSRQHPSFIMPAQYHAAVKVVVMPIDSLHRLADRIGNPKGKLVFVSNCARCGSTLLTQMFEATERMVAFGEPSCLNFLARANEHRKSQEDRERFERLVVSTVRVLCKSTESGQEIGYLVKIISPSMTSIPLLMRLFPDSVHLYMYRDPVKVAQSLYRLSCSLYSMKFLYFFGKNSAGRLATCISALGFPRSQYRVELKHDLSIGVLNWCVLLRQYLEFRKSGLAIAAVRYEDLVQDAVEARRSIFRYCNLPMELADKAGEAMKWDSQKGTPLSVEVLRQYPLLKCEGNAKMECEQLMEKYGFPRLDEEYIAEKTITYTKTNKT